MLDLSYEINSLKKRIAEAKEQERFEQDERDLAVLRERIQRLTEMLDFCYNLLGD